jgi:hypothetical protein
MHIIHGRFTKEGYFENTTGINNSIARYNISSKLLWLAALSITNIDEENPKQPLINLIEFTQRIR